MLSLKDRLTTRNTMLAIATVIVALMLASIAHTQETLKFVDSLIVVDSNGKTVGEVISINDNLNTPTVAFKLDKLAFVLNVRQERLEGNGLVFESSDCTGTPYLIPIPDSPLPSVAINVPGNTLYVPDSTSSPQEKMIGSMTGSASGCMSLDPNLNHPIVIKAIPTVDLNQIFTPPFKVEGGAEVIDHGKGKDKGKGKG